MILHPGAHFGDFPHPIDSGGIEGAPLGATPNREPAVVHRSGCFQSRVHWPALTLRHRHPVVRRHRVRFTDEALVPTARRKEGAKGAGRKDRETRATKRVLKFRRLHLVHSSAVAARQTVAVTTLILEFSLSLPPLSPSAFPPSLPVTLSLSLSLVFFLLLSFLALGKPADFLRKISARRDIGFLCEVHSDFVYVLPNILLRNIFARKIARVFFISDNKIWLNLGNVLFFNFQET